MFCGFRSARRWHQTSRTWSSPGVLLVRISLNYLCCRPYDCEQLCREVVFCLLTALTTALVLLSPRDGLSYEDGPEDCNMQNPDSNILLGQPTNLGFASNPLAATTWITKQIHIVDSFDALFSAATGRRHGLGPQGQNPPSCVFHSDFVSGFVACGDMPRLLQM